jgi:2-methylcitrate dehydratase PrpD
MENVTQTLVNFAVGTKFEKLPPDLVHEAKRCILDCIGCALAGADTNKGKYAVQLAKRLGGQPEATIIGAENKVSVCNAAFANGELINALDFDVGSDPHHAPPCLIPASLATAENAGASGKDLILALVTGLEISARIAAGLPVMLKRSEAGTWELTPGHGHGCCSIGAAASAGKILKFDFEKMSRAFGISAFAAPVPTYARWSQSLPIPMTKYAFIGWTSMAGVTSALLADIGYTGDTTVLDGEFGFWRFHSNDKSFWDPQKVIGQIGEKWYWLTSRRMYKPYPSCGIFMTSLGGFINLIDKNNLKAEDMEYVKVRIAIPLLKEPNTVWYNREIKTGIDAQFSAPYLFAAAANGIRAASDWQDSRTIKDARILKFMNKVSVSEWSDCPDMSGSGPNSIPYAIEIKSKGKIFKEDKIYTIQEQEILKNSWMPDTELIRKFKGNAARQLPGPQADKAASLIMGLETIENVSELTICLINKNV